MESNDWAAEMRRHQAAGFKALCLGTLLRLALLAAVVLAFWPSTGRAQVPRAAAQYRAELVRTAHAVWGLNAPVATFAAQVHQESGWKVGAVSQVGAAGLAQFMPSTSKWIAGLYPELRSDQPFNPAWSLRALVTYDAWLWNRVKAANGCDGFAKVLSSYNGGLGWVQRDEALAKTKGLDPQLWFGQVDQVNAGRSAAAWRENRDYPRRILRTHEPLYVAAGWGLGVCT